MILILLILILIVVIALGIMISLKLKEKKRKPDYKVLYIIGISWFPLGVVFTATGLPIGVVFSITGLVLMAVGLLNRDKWQDAKPMTVNQKKHSVALIIIGGIVIFITLIAYIIRMFE